MHRILWLLVLLSLVQPGWGQDITLGLTLWWKFDDGSSTSVSDSSGNARTGALAGTQHWQAAGACKVGTCLGFVATDSNQVTNSTLLSALMSATAGTVGVWVQPHGTPPNGSVSYATSGVYGEASQVMGIFRGTRATVNDSLWLYNYDGDEDRIGVPYTVDTWTHITWVHGGGQLTAYKNGQLATGVVSTCTGSAANANPCLSGNTSSLAGSVIMGKSTTGAVYLTADVDELRVYNRALTAADVQALFEFGLGQSNRWRMMRRWHERLASWLWARRWR